MPEKSLSMKLKMKPGVLAALISAPEGYLPSLAPLPDRVDIDTTLAGQYDWVQVFVQNAAELADLLPQLVTSLKPESLLWISFPKGSSKIQTDLTRDKGWGALLPYGLKWVTLISVNETWSAFALRPYKPGEAKTRDWVTG